MPEIGDSPWLAWLARAVGLRTGWVNHAHRIHDIGNHEPDHEFEDLHGLAALVASWSCPPNAG